MPPPTNANGMEPSANGQNRRHAKNPARANRILATDATNNVEIVRLEPAPGGSYLIQIVASNLLAPQDFAVVVTGSLSTPLTEV